MSGCGPTAPSVGAEGCFFHDAVCDEKPPAPPAVRKDPCEGLTLQTQNANVPANSCVKWSYIRQNNGIGREVYNNLYQNGDIVRVCTEGNQMWLQNQDAFRAGLKITGKCAPPGGFTPSPTDPLPAPRLKANITCSASEDDPNDGGR